jgi:plexin A
MMEERGQAVTKARVIYAAEPCLAICKMYLVLMQIREGPVIVKIEDFRGQSKETYKFVDPKIMSISPTHGPVSGGTRLSISGHYMNAGSRIQAFIDKLPCEINNTEHDEVLCITSASDRKRKGPLYMYFDNSMREYNGFFEYVDDPKIESVESGVGGGQLKIPKGIPSGGIKINITGTNLGYIQKPEMYVYYEGKQYFSQACTILSQTNMVCKSPEIDVPTGVLDAEKPLALEYGFRMDNVARVQNLTQQKLHRFLLYPDPVYEVFDKEIKDYKVSLSLSALAPSFRRGFLIWNFLLLNEFFSIWPFRATI